MRSRMSPVKLRRPRVFRAKNRRFRATEGPWGDMSADSDRE
jgi:hypothetical protein